MRHEARKVARDPAAILAHADAGGAVSDDPAPDDSVLTIAIDLGDTPAALPDVSGELLHAEGDRFRAWIGR